MVARALLSEMTFGTAASRERPLGIHIPYARHVDDRTVRTKTGLLLTTLKLDGYCFETADMSEINARLIARNDLVRMLGNSRFALYQHIIRREVEPGIPSTFENAFCAELDRRYHEALGKRRMFVNDIYLTIVRRPLQGQAGNFEGLLAAILGKKTAGGHSAAEAEALSELSDVTTAIRETLGAYGARSLSVEARDGIWHSQPLEFLLQLVNGGVPRPMPLPRMPLDEALSQKRIFFGRNAIEIRGASDAETRFGAMLSIREYPAFSGPGSLDLLLKIPHEFILTQSFAIIDRPEAAKQIDRITRQVDMSDEAESVVADHLAIARDELLASEAIYGEHHFSVMPLGRNLHEVNAAITALGAALTDRSVIWVREDLNCEPAFWAQLPGNFAYIARKATLSSKNFSGFASLHNYPSGQPNGNHWGPALSVFETSSQTAYYFNAHIRDLGNFTVVGPSGSGKTVFLSFLSAQAQRIVPRPKLLFVDKDRGAEIFIRAMGGQYEVLVPGEPTGFNPLALPDNGENREFLFQLFAYMLKPVDDRLMSASEEQVIRNAIAAVLTGPVEGKTLPAFATLLRGRIRAGEGDLLGRLETWLRQDQRGWLFNNKTDKFSAAAKSSEVGTGSREDFASDQENRGKNGFDQKRFASGSIYGFDMTRVLDDPVIRTAALMYIFHRTNELLNGDPVMIFLDEGWRLLDDEVFASFIKDKLKTIRKQNGIIGFGTQSAADIVRSKSANTLIEQTATNIFFPNPKADDESYRKAFRLSAREVEWIRTSVPEQRSFLIKHGQDSVIAKLNLSGMSDLIKVLSGRTETVAELELLMGTVGTDPSIWLPIFMGRASASGGNPA